MVLRILVIAIQPQPRMLAVSLTRQSRLALFLRPLNFPTDRLRDFLRVSRTS